MNWWIPLAFAAAGLAGAVIALSLTAGRPRAEPAAEPDPGAAHGHGAPRKSRYRQDNDLSWNPGAFVAAAMLIGTLVLVGVLIEVL